MPFFFLNSFAITVSKKFLSTGRKKKKRKKKKKGTVEHKVHRIYFGAKRHQKMFLYFFFWLFVVLLKCEVV